MFLSLKLWSSPCKHNECRKLYFMDKKNMQAEVWVSFLITFKYKIIILVHFPYLSFDCVHCSSNMNQSWANPTPSNKLTTIVYGHLLFDTWNRKKKRNYSMSDVAPRHHGNITKSIKAQMSRCVCLASHQFKPESETVNLHWAAAQRGLTFCDYPVHAAATRWQCFHVLSYSPPS